MPKTDWSRLKVGVPKWWGDYRPCRVLKVPMGSMFTYLGREFGGGLDQSSATVRNTCIVWLALINVSQG